MNERAKILVIDDSKSSMMELSGILRDTGFHVVAAMNGKSGIKKAMSNPIDLILLDVVMSGMDGFEVCIKLKENKETRDIPVIFITVDSNKESVVKGFDAGAIDYVNKPFNKKELIARINTQLELSRSKEALKVAMNEAKHHDKLMSSFLANMSHEIRTPINAILGFAQLLQLEEESDEERQKFISIILNSSNQLIDLINDILEVSKIDAGKITIKLKPVEINQFLDELILSYKILNETNKKVSFKLNRGSKNKLLINTDKGKLYQILNNLLSNAVKFTSEGIIELGYRIIEDNGAFCEFYIKDTGIGIPKHKHEIVFDRFIRIENNLEREYGGTGLGLHISKKLVNLLNGKIWIESEINKGSCFYFTVACS
ncbi:MAG: response regulator [Bacteroidota bacterium]|nr:response regulator [Bacteroidota bacterium]